MDAIRFSLLAVLVLAVSGMLSNDVSAENETEQYFLNAGNGFSTEYNDGEAIEEKPASAWTENMFGQTRSREWTTIGTWESEVLLHDLTIDGAAFNMWWVEDDTDDDYNARFQMRWTVEMSDGESIAYYEDDDEYTCGQERGNPCEWWVDLVSENDTDVILSEGLSIIVTIEYQSFQDIYIYYDNVTFDSGVTWKCVQCQHYAVDIVYTSITTVETDPGSTAQFNFTVTNNGNGEDSFNIVSTASLEWNPTLSNLSVTLQANEVYSGYLRMTIPEDMLFGENSGAVKISAHSNGDSADEWDDEDGDGIWDEGVEQLTVDHNGNGVYDPGTYDNMYVQVKVSQVHDVEFTYRNNISIIEVWGGYQNYSLGVNVTNMGNGADQIRFEFTNLSNSSAANWLEFSPDVEYLSPGDTASVGIRASPYLSTTAGTYTFTVTAMSYGTIKSGESQILTVIVKQSEPIDPGPGNPPEDNIPVAIAGSNVTIKSGDTVQFNGQGTDEDGTIVKYEWDFDGNGVYDWSSEDNGITTFIYNTEGIHIAILRVTDNDEHTAIDSFTITVNDDDDSPYPFGIPGPSLIAALGVLLAVARRRR